MPGCATSRTGDLGAYVHANVRLRFRSQPKPRCIRFPAPISRSCRVCFMMALSPRTRFESTVISGMVLKSPVGRSWGGRKHRFLVLQTISTEAHTSRHGAQAWGCLSYWNDEQSFDAGSEAVREVFLDDTSTCEASPSREELTVTTDTTVLTFSVTDDDSPSVGW